MKSQASSTLVKATKQVVKRKEIQQNDKENEPVITIKDTEQAQKKNFGGIPFIRSKKHTATKEFKLSGSKTKQ